MFNLDPNAAKAADVKSATIQAAGKYKGRIVVAEYVENQQKGSKNIRLVFKSDAGQEASFFLNMVYAGTTVNESNHKMLSAILACMKMRSTGNVAAGRVEKWNKDKQVREMVDASVFPDLAGKEIGFLIQMEIEKNSENGYPRPVIYLPFEASSEKTASEVLANPPVMQGTTLEKAVAYIAEHSLVDRRKNSDAGRKPEYNTANATAGGSAAQYDDDIPW